MLFPSALFQQSTNHSTIVLSQLRTIEQKLLFYGPLVHIQVLEIAVFA